MRYRCDVCHYTKAEMKRCDHCGKRTAVVNEVKEYDPLTGLVEVREYGNSKSLVESR